jgi:hypothetical protein
MPPPPSAAPRRKAPFSKPSSTGSKPTSSSGKPGFKRPFSGGGANNKKPDQGEQLRKKLKASAELSRDARNELVLRMNKLWNDLRSADTEEDKQVHQL